MTETDNDPIYAHFLGTWELDTATCDYQQGEPPWSDIHRIRRDGDDLVIEHNWTDAEGEEHTALFRGLPDGNRAPFDGRPLADQLQLTAPSEHELNMAAFRDGLELMTATRTMADDGMSLELVQTVHLPDLTTSTNRAIYLRVD